MHFPMCVLVLKNLNSFLCDTFIVYSYCQYYEPKYWIRLSMVYRSYKRISQEIKCNQKRRNILNEY